VADKFRSAANNVLHVSSMSSIANIVTVLLEECNKSNETHGNTNEQFSTCIRQAVL